MQVASKLDSGKKREWFLKQEIQLYDGASLESRLKAGLSHTTTTTNLAENRNRFLKTALGRRLPIQLLLKKLFELHSDLIAMFALALFGNESEFRLRDGGRFSFWEGELLADTDKIEFAKRYGLEDHIRLSRKESLPLWLYDGRLGVSQKKFSSWVESIQFTRSASTPDRFYSDDTDFSGAAAIPFVSFDGGTISCSCKSGRWLVCPHLCAFFLYLKDDDEKRMVEELLRKRLQQESIDDRNLRLRSGTEGNKPYAKRRGSKRTADNYIRSFEKKKSYSSVESSSPPGLAPSTSCRRRTRRHSRRCGHSRAARSVEYLSLGRSAPPG